MDVVDLTTSPSNSPYFDFVMLSIGKVSKGMMYHVGLILHWIRAPQELLTLKTTKYGVL